MLRHSWLAVVAVCAASCFAARPVAACPFCAAQSQTFCEEIGAMDAAVIAKLTQAVPANPATGSVGKAKFAIAEVLKGGEHVAGVSEVETIYFGDGKPGGEFLILGVGPPKLMWSTPLALSPRSKQYLTAALKLPKEGPERLEYFQQFLEDDDPLLQRDSYDEFAKAPYATVKALQPKMNLAQLTEWLRDADIPASRRRLYFVMLSVCGGEAELPMLEEMLRSSDRKVKAGLDAMIACYLTLKGPPGLRLIEQLFLANSEAEYADTYSAIMALRFHGTESDVLPRPEVVAAMRLILDRPALADLVIPDLARWEDWESMDRLMELYRTADDKSSWVRVPVINYLRACPLPEAAALLKECEQIDPGAVKRANTFFPLGAPPEQPKTSVAPRPDPPSAGVAAGPAEDEAAATLVAAEQGEEIAARPLRSLHAARPAAGPALAPAPSDESVANLLALIAVPTLGSIAVMAVLWSILYPGPAPRG